ncbi:MAG: DUF4838 domain-containing protein [Bacteroidales bacterium]|nr:DUF4838 domain-containing protein [Bacteroidales bacterium]
MRHFKILGFRSELTAILFTLAVTIFLLFQSCSQEKESLSIGNNGNIESIIIPDNSDEVINFAASELQEYLKKITGKELEISETTEASSGRSISLTVDSNEDIIWDGFRIETTKKGIVILANESRGLLNAVYTILEEKGCSFVYPGEEEEIVPSITLVEFPAVEKTYNPIVRHRGLTPYGLHGGSVETGRTFIDWMGKNRMNFIIVSEDRPSDTKGPAHANIWKEVDDELLPELQKRGFTIDMSEHCTQIFFPRSLFKDHPDWFALNDGERKLGELPYAGQICYSNKDAVEYYATEVAAYATEHPEMHFIGTWPLDGGNYCECEDCKDSLTVFRAAMRVAEKVGEVRPDMIVEHLAYKPQTWHPPAMEKLPANMSVLWCRPYHEIDHLLKEWVDKTEHGGGVYKFEYFMGDNYNLFANVWLRPEYSANLVPHVQEMGLRGVISLYLPIENWWRSSFNNWFFARACWNPEFNVDELLTEYCERYYGDQATEIKEVFNIVLTEFQPEPYISPLEAGSSRLEQVRTSSEKIFNKLDEITAGAKDDKVLVRIERLKTFVEFSLLHCEAFSSLDIADLNRLVEYSREHRHHEMVVMYPDYVEYRNLNNFREH